MASQYAFATIITSSHLGYVRTLAQSLGENSEKHCLLHCLIVDGDQTPPAETVNHKADICYYGVDLVAIDQIGTTIREKYLTCYQDAFRWSMKSVFVRFLLCSGKADAVAFVDPDQFFVGNPAVVFEQLSTSRFLLSPHDRPIDPAAGSLFYDQFTDGMFNGGLFVARHDSADVLTWWAKACAHRCEKNSASGLFVDQKYLDAVLTNFSATDWIRHRGVNVASWNMTTRRRSNGPDGQILIDTHPLICVHFSGSTIRMIDQNADPVLAPVLREYRSCLEHHGITLSPDGSGSSKQTSKHVPAKKRSWFSRASTFLRPNTDSLSNAPTQIRKSGQSSTDL
ncbi:MAG: hypothetical protein R3C59_24420 [Planctomycetaceae bacterium]